ncbi:beta/gamma crystallin domain-containing protein [Streptomyces sp. NY05-11A]|uniref:beta/gamma crystallin domain-containing protein n=1 Tax=Streptomyces soliscabiei TaxID=588897 RepID=UPI0029BF3DB3|nr:beta/gamma crystallin domain-containing protein [Streptomyces sp. NY05-11A]MDX2680420.1 beta/gamma crystallin domain-containing protein [Streptomyces sp. NY05-11A]
MNRRTKQVVLSALTTVMAAASLTIGTASQASAINEVPCTRPDFTHLYGHSDLEPSFPQWEVCYANAGEQGVNPKNGTDWLEQINAGNNRVQWYGDGRWQPNAPIEKWVHFTFPNHPGGVRIDKVKIL